MNEKRPLRLLFVCTGNLCRSPMAAGIADRVALELDLEVEIRSAGTLGLVGRPAAGHAVAVCREIGVDLDAHRSQGLTEELVRWADHVYVMEHDHAVRVRELAPDLGDDQVVSLGPYAGHPFIVDPHRSWFRFTFRKTRDDLLTALRHALAQVAAERR